MTVKTKASLFFKPENQWIISIGVIFGLALAFTLPLYMSLVVKLGHRIVQTDLITDYTTAVAWAAVLGVSILFWPVRNEDKAHLLWAWLLKCIMCLFVLLYYENYFHTDSIGYYAVAKMDHIYIDTLIEGKLLSSFGTGDTHVYQIQILVYYYNKIVPDFLADSYHSLKLSFAMVALIASYIFFRASIILTQKKNWNFFWFLLLFPSLLIYGSQVGKEPLVFLFISFFAYGIVGWHRRKKAGYIFLALMGFALCFFIRPWMAGLFAPSLVIYFFLTTRGMPAKIVAVLLTSLIFLSSFNFIKHKLHINSELTVFKKLEEQRSHFYGGGSAMSKEIPKLSGIGDLIMEAPYAIFSGLFRPLPFEIPGPLGFLSGLEGLLLLFLFLRATKRTHIKELREPLVAWALALLICWATIYGYVTQNFGTLIRYKVMILPIFLGLLFYLGRSRSENLKLGSKSA